MTNLCPVTYPNSNKSRYTVLLGEENLGGEKPHVGRGWKLPGRQQVQGLWVDVPSLQLGSQRGSGALDSVQRVRGPASDTDLNLENELVDFFTKVMERRKLNKWD